MSAASLPQGFDSLEPFIATWAKEDAQTRADLRHERTPAERQAFYDAIAPLAREALAYLDRRPIAGYTVGDRRLMAMLLSYAHAALAVEVQKDHEPYHAGLRRHLRITRASADF